MQSIYRISDERDFPFNNDFDYKSISASIKEYKESNKKTPEWHDSIFREIAMSHCFREIRILLIHQLENNDE